METLEHEFQSAVVEHKYRVVLAKLIMGYEDMLQNGEDPLEELSGKTKREKATSALLPLCFSEDKKDQEHFEELYEYAWANLSQGTKLEELKEKEDYDFIR